jgi:hypothetical protein
MIVYIWMSHNQLLGSLGSKQQLYEMVSSLSSNDKCYGSPKPWSNKPWFNFNTLVNIITSMEEHDINVQVEFMSNS